MLELLGALVAGVRTTLAPCVLPLLPVVVGGSMAGALAEERAPVAPAARVGVATATHESLRTRSASRLGSARRRDGVGGEILTGAALGPVFTSRSPLYGYVIVTVLPAEPVRGLILVGTYILGLCATLLVIALAGQRVVARFGWAADPHGWFRRAVGVVFIVVGVLAATGAMKGIETWLVVNAQFAPWNLDSRFIG